MSFDRDSLGKDQGINTLAYWTKLAIISSALIAGLVFGANFLIPLFVSLILFVLLTAIIDWVANKKIGDWQAPRWLAHVVAVVLVLIGLGAIVLVIGSQASDVTAALPRYEAKLTQILSSIVSTVGEENAKVAQDALAGLDYSNFAVTTVNSASSFMSSFLLVLLYIPFLLLERRPMGEKLPLAAGSLVMGRKISTVFADISVGIQRYVGIKTFVSFLTGTLSYAVMKSTGLDFAETWSVLAFALNFIPTIGSMLAVVLPSLVALVQFDTLGPFLGIVLGCGAVQFAIGNVLEPTLAGKTLNLSPFMVILSLTFWTSIWGIPGAFLSVPITVCVLIVFSHIPATRPVAILMSGGGQLRLSSDQGSERPEKPQPPSEPRTAVQNKEVD